MCARENRRDGFVICEFRGLWGQCLYCSCNGGSLGRVKVGGADAKQLGLEGLHNYQSHSLSGI